MNLLASVWETVPRCFEYGTVLLGPMNLFFFWGGGDS